MDEEIVQQIVDEVLSSLEPLETQSAAILQFLKAKGLATDEELAPFLEQAGNASNVRWRAVRVRTAALISKAMKPEAQPGASSATQRAQPAPAAEPKPEKAQEEEGSKEESGSKKEAAQKETAQKETEFALPASQKSRENSPSAEAAAIPENGAKKNESKKNEVKNNEADKQDKNATALANHDTAAKQDTRKEDSTKEKDPKEKVA